MPIHKIILIFSFSILMGCNTTASQTSEQNNSNSYQMIADDRLSFGEEFNTYDSGDFGFLAKLPQSWLNSTSETINENFYKAEFSNLKNAQISIHVERFPTLVGLDPEASQKGYKPEALIKMAQDGAISGQTIESEGFTIFHEETAYQVIASDKKWRQGKEETARYTSYYFMHNEFLFLITAAISASATEEELEDYNSIFENLQLL